MDEKISNYNPESESLINLPIKSEELGVFISGLLGQKQAIERSVGIIFDIDHSWIINLHHTIDQRVMQQSNAYLTSFRAVIYFEGGVKRTIDTFQAFESYVETKTLRSIGIKIIWKYLIHFPTKPSPEEQQVSFEAFSQVLDKKSKIDDIPVHDFGSSIKYQIDHTERTWGDDIESIIQGQVKSTERPRNSNYWPIQCVRILMLPIIIFFSMLLINNFVPNSKDVEISDLLSQYASIDSGASLVVVSNKLDIILGVLTAPQDRVLNIISMIGIFLIVIACIMFWSVSVIKQYSYINLTKKSQQYKDAMNRKENRSILIVIGSFIFSIFSGLITNVIANVM